MAQAVDPFIPITPRSAYPKKRPLSKPIRRVRRVGVGNDILRHAAGATTRPRTSVVHVQARSAAATTPQAAPTTHAQPAEPQASGRKHKDRRWLYYAKIALGCIGMLAVGSLAQIAVAGEILICVYAVWALVTRIPSRTTFLLALGTFAAILLLLMARPDQILMKNFATYAFLFLLVGVLSLVREARD